MIGAFADLPCARGGKPCGHAAEKGDESRRLIDQPSQAEDRTLPVSLAKSTGVSGNLNYAVQHPVPYCITASGRQSSGSGAFVALLLRGDGRGCR
jgi:hypothetical protein